MPISQNPQYGSFSAEPDIRFVDRPGQPNRDVQLLNDFHFNDAVTGLRWSAPANSLVNGASIPRILWTSVGSPFTGDYFYASIVHDVACDTHTRTSEEAHLMFYHACLAGGTPLPKAKIMYLAVRNFGPRWRAATKGMQPITRVMAADEHEQERYVARAQEYLNQHGADAPLEDIDAYATQPQ